jgi:hypothetical protein
MRTCSSKTCLGSAYSQKSENLLQGNLLQENLLQENLLQENLLQENLLQENLLQENLLQENLLQEALLRREEDLLQDHLHPEISRIPLALQLYPPNRAAQGVRGGGGCSPQNTPPPLTGSVGYTPSE